MLLLLVQLLGRRSALGLAWAASVLESGVPRPRINTSQQLSN